MPAGEYPGKDTALVRQVAVVTGASGGIGRWIGLGVAQAGCHVVLVCRDAVRGEAVRRWIIAQAPASQIELRVADLRSLRAARQLGRDIAAAHPQVALLVNNAGIFTARRQLTTEGRESVLAVNHLSPFILMEELQGVLRAGAPSRIVNVGSSTADRGGIDPDDLELARHWGMVRAYRQSKLAMMMTTFAAAERLLGSSVVANVVHPGMVASGLIRAKGLIGLAWRLMAPFQLTEEQGADTPLHVALAAEWRDVTGAYAKDRVAVQPNRLVLDAALVARVERATRDLVATVK